MLEIGVLKPWLTAIALPPAGLLLTMLLGYVMLVRSEKIIWTALGKMLAVFSFALLWLACCQGTAIWLERVMLRPPGPVDPQLMAITVKQQQIQAVIVLGGGQQSISREYGESGLSETSAQRLHYGATLARASNLPLGFAGGVGWLQEGAKDSEAAAAQRWLNQLGLSELRWSEGHSRDTQGNALHIADVLQKSGVERIALVTSASHMPRALKAFAQTPLKVTPAPTQFLEQDAGLGLDWFPSGSGLRRTRQVLHELLGLALIPRG
ncbi:MAG: YdcF family protein [Brachymonas sp.]|nr:YdcF family protein [Brachymonas sp.]